jgi:hypothetical protein
MMQTTDLREGNDLASGWRVYWARLRAILVERQMCSAVVRAALLASCAMLLSNQVYAAGTNNPPPAGPVIYELTGMAVPHTYTEYTTSFIAGATSTDFSFAFREDPAFLSLSTVSVTTGGGSNLLLNSDFSAGPVGVSAPTNWTYLNTFGATFGGVVAASCGLGGGNCYYDGAVQAYDAITQNIATTMGATYNVSFWLDDNSGLTTFSALSTNGDTTDTGGNGIDLLVYAGNGVPVVATPLPAALPLFATGLGALGLLGWRRKRKAQVAA